MPASRLPFAPLHRHCGALVAALCLAAPLPALAHVCPPTGQWQQDGGEVVTPERLIGEMAERRVVLLGEQHDSADHHRWQLQTLAGLQSHRSNMLIGLEMLPREVQPALDDWIAGELDEKALLEASRWDEFWGVDPALYLPILHFARLNRIPLVALNVTPELRSRLAEQGWDAVPAAERHGLTPPAQPPAAYVESLESIYVEHAERGEAPGDLERFIASQLVWDRAMASGLAEASDADTLVVGLMGSGHIAHGHGVPHQLADLGIADTGRLLPWTLDEACEPPEAGIADAIFTLDTQAPGAPSHPLLGVMIAPHEDGLEILRVTPDSVAEAAGLEVGDIIVNAAGRPMEMPADLVALVRSQTPGTLLPLEIQHGGTTEEVLARFPAPTP